MAQGPVLRNAVTTAHYAGEMVNGLREGYGTYIYPNPYFRYTGEWHCNKRHGRGVLFLGDGSSYDGEFFEGEIQGSGCKRWDDGTTYVGEFRFGELHGQGTYVSAKGEQYEGAYRDNRRHGRGHLVRSDGSSYIGEFEVHKFHGKGRYTNENGDVFDGVWSQGKLFGSSRIEYANGDLYEGECKEGRRHGAGAYTCANRPLSYSGQWSDDRREEQPTKLQLAQVLLGHEPVVFSGERFEFPLHQPLGLAFLTMRAVYTAPPEIPAEEKEAIKARRKQSLVAETKGKKKFKNRDTAAYIQEMMEKLDAEMNQPKCEYVRTSAESGRQFHLTLWKPPQEKDKKEKKKKEPAGEIRKPSPTGNRGDLSARSIASGASLDAFAHRGLPEGCEQLNFATKLELPPEPVADTPKVLPPTPGSSKGRGKKGSDQKKPSTPGNDPAEDPRGREKTAPPPPVQRVTVAQLTAASSNGVLRFDNVFLPRECDASEYILLCEDATSAADGLQLGIVQSITIQMKLV